MLTFNSLHTKERLQANRILWASRAFKASFVAIFPWLEALHFDISSPRTSLSIAKHIILRHTSAGSGFGGGRLGRSGKRTM